MDIINCTDHHVFVHDEHQLLKLILQPAEYPARRVNVYTRTGTIPGREIPLFTTDDSPVVNLPEPKSDTLYVVSYIIRDSLRHKRSDLVSPGRPIRNTSGEIVGCIGLVS